MNFENRLESSLEHWFDLSLFQKVKTCTVIAFASIFCLAVFVVIVTCIWILPAAFLGA